TYASHGFTRGDPFLVSVPTNTNWKRSSESWPSAVISGAAVSSSAHVSIGRALQTANTSGRQPGTRHLRSATRGLLLFRALTEKVRCRYDSRAPGAPRHPR